MAYTLQNSVVFFRYLVVTFTFNYISLMLCFIFLFVLALLLSWFDDVGSLYLCCLCNWPLDC
jgi:ABC-type sugar transport system permease subunit